MSERAEANHGKRAKLENIDDEKKKEPKKSQKKPKDFVCRRCGDENAENFFKSAVDTKNWICKKCTKASLNPTPYSGMMRYLKRSSPNPETLLKDDDLEYLFENVWKKTCVISQKSGDKKSLAFVILNPREDMTPWNLILVDKKWALAFRNCGFSESIIPADSKKKIDKKIEKVKLHYTKENPWLEAK